MQYTSKNLSQPNLIDKLREKHLTKVEWIEWYESQFNFFLSSFKIMATDLSVGII